MNAQPRSPFAPSADADQPVIEALVAKMIACPQFANEVVTGACVWPPENGNALTLYFRAADQAIDNTQCRALGLPEKSWWDSVRLTAAIRALGTLAGNEPIRFLPDDPGFDYDAGDPDRDPSIYASSRYNGVLRDRYYERDDDE